MNDNSQENKPGNDTRPCPICAETIKTEAKKCIHCGEFLEGPKGWWWHSWWRFRPKTLWDLLGLLVVPTILILIGTQLNIMETDRQAGLATANARSITGTARAMATEALRATRTAEVIEATKTAAPFRTAEVEATADAIRAGETLIAARTANAVIAAETAKAISTAAAEATANAIRAEEAKATADAVRAQEIIEAARAEGKAAAEAEATAAALRVAETLAAARTAEAMRVAESLAAAVQTAQASATESARTYATAEAAATISAAQTAEALATVAKFTGCVEPQGELHSFWIKYRFDLGCPKEITPIDGTFAEQQFQNGYMFWSAVTDQFIVTIGSDSGTWYLLSEISSKYTVNPEGVSCEPDTPPPPGLFQPERGFGGIWCYEGNIQQSIGWATEKEHYEGSDLLQEFENAFVLRDSQEQVYILKDDRTYIRKGP